MWGKFIRKTIEFVWKPQCTEHLPLYSWYPPHLWYPPLYSGKPPLYWIPPSILMLPPVYWTFPGVLMISPTLIMVSPSVLNTPTVLMISPTLIMVSPAVFMVSSYCPEHSPVYSWYPPSVLNIPWCTAQTLCRVFTASNFLTDYYIWGILYIIIAFPNRWAHEGDVRGSLLVGELPMTSQSICLGICIQLEVIESNLIIFVGISDSHTPMTFQDEQLTFSIFAQYGGGDEYPSFSASI